MGPKSILISLKSEWIQTTCLLVSESDMYSASVEESAIDFCALEFQQNVPFVNFTRQPVVDLLVIRSDAKSESAYAIKPSLLLPSKTKA